MAGVKVIVREPRRPEPRKEPRAWEPRPAVDAITPDPRKADRDALIEALCAKHRPSVVAMIVRLGNIARDKAEDVAQKVLLLLREEVQESGPPPSVPAFLASAIRFELRNFRRVEGRAPRPGADVDAPPTSDPSPERVAELSQQRRKLKRYLTRLPKAEADAIDCVDIHGMTLEEASEELGCPPGTVASRQARGVEMLKKLARISARETEMGLRRRPGR